MLPHFVENLLPAYPFGSADTILIIYSLVYISMAIQYCVLLSILPSLVAIRFSLSQQLIWIFGSSFSAYRFRTGGREAAARREASAKREAAVRQFAGGANERSRKIYIAITTRGQGQRYRASPCTYDGDGFQKRAKAQEPKVAPFHAELKNQRPG
jgi:hypothetical protein